MQRGRQHSTQCAAFDIELRLQLCETRPGRWPRPGAEGASRVHPAAAAACAPDASRARDHQQQQQQEGDGEQLEGQGRVVRAGRGMCISCCGASC